MIQRHAKPLVQPALMPAQQTEKTIDALRTGKLNLEGEFVLGSNYTFLVKVESVDGETFLAVYKPQEGERILWDFPDNTLAHREVAAYLLSEALGWGLIPPTVYRNDGPFGPGSVQLFIKHDPNHHYFNFSDEEFQQLRPVVIFDIIANNADRKGGHIIFGEGGKMWLIDHGLCFSVDDKLRTVIWDFAGDPIPNEVCTTLHDFRQKMNPPSELVAALGEHLNPEEIAAIAARTDALLPCTQFPSPPNDRRAYPFPPV